MWTILFVDKSFISLKARLFIVRIFENSNFYVRLQYIILQNKDYWYFKLNNSNGAYYYQNLFNS